jgi:hypothetical protein
MIPTRQAFEIINESFPQLSLNCDECANKPFKYFDEIATYAVAVINDQEYATLKRLFELLGDLYVHSDNVIKMCIDCVFIYRILTPIEATCNRDHFISLMPSCLSAIVHRQINASAI